MKSENHWRGINELYGLYLLHYTKGQMHIYLIVSSIKIITKHKFFAVYRFKSARMVSCLDLLYGRKLWCCENLTKLMADQTFSKFFPSKLLYIYSKVSCEYQTKWKHFWHMPNNLQGTINYFLDSHGLWIVWISHFSFTR